MSSIDDTLHEVYIPTKEKPAPKVPGFRLEGITFRFERGLTHRLLSWPVGDVHHTDEHGTVRVHRVAERTRVLPPGDVLLFWHPGDPSTFQLASAGDLDPGVLTPRQTLPVLSVVDGVVTTFFGGALVSAAAGALGPKTPVLMSRENPGGWKLEDLLHTLYVELEEKTAKIEDDERPVARRTTRRNLRIMDLLQDAEGLQRASVADLAGLAPDPGPLGTPRIGAGSQPAA